MPELYLPGAELHLLDAAPMAGDGGSRALHHITWDKNATAAKPLPLVPFENLKTYFGGAGSGSAPHLLIDPFTGRAVQFFPATSRSKSVINAPGGVETNRKGNICIQVEWVFFPYCTVDGRVYATLRDTPMAGLDRLMPWLRSWGVPDVWPMGEPDWTSRRDAGVWNSRPGHYGHSQIPENDHNDPGPMPDIFSEEDVALTPEDVRLLFNSPLGDQYATTDQWGGRFVPTLADAANGGAYATQKAQEALEAVNALAAKVDRLAAGGGTVDANAFADAVVARVLELLAAGQKAGGK